MFVFSTVRGDLVRTFAALNERRKQFNAIIIETTGLADPAPILFTFNTNDFLKVRKFLYENSILFLSILRTTTASIALCA